jgi:site-specific recombinase XerD
LTRRAIIFPDSEREPNGGSTSDRRCEKRTSDAGGCFTGRSKDRALHHSFATQPLDSGYDIWTVQGLLGHKDVKTTMIYTHVLNGGGKGVKSPVDDL